jgi:hypothetical protein
MSENDWVELPPSPPAKLSEEEWKALDERARRMREPRPTTRLLTGKEVTEIINLSNGITGFLYPPHDGPAGSNWIIVAALTDVLGMHIENDGHLQEVVKELRSQVAHWMKVKSWNDSRT